MKNLILIMCVVLMIGEVATKAESIVFTESGEILEGEVWDIVDIFGDETIVDMFGGIADYITTHDWSMLNVTGGHAQFGAIDYSTMNISDGSHSGAAAYGHGTVNLFGDAQIVGGLGADDLGIVNMTGGTVHHVGASGEGEINLYAGIISEDIGAFDSSVINIFGHDLFKSSFGGTYGDGQVWGFFTDDTPFTIDLYGAQTYSHINLIPEPGTLCLLGLGALVLRKKW